MSVLPAWLGLQIAVLKLPKLLLKSLLKWCVHEEKKSQYCGLWCCDWQNHKTMDINYSQKTSILLTKRTQCQSHGVLFLMEAMMEIKEISITSCKVSVIFGSECLKCNSLLISWVLNWPASVSCLGMQIIPQFHDLQPKVRLSMIFVIYFRVFWKQFQTLGNFVTLPWLAIKWAE